AKPHRASTPVWRIPMRARLLAVGCVGLLAACALCATQADNDPVKIRLNLIDAESGQPLAGLVRVLTDEGAPISLVGLYERMTGLDKKELALGWHVLPAG